MSKIDKIPVIVQQAIESLLDDRVPSHIRFNHLITLENIRDCATKAILDYNKKTK